MLIRYNTKDCSSKSYILLRMKIQMIMLDTDRKLSYIIMKGESNLEKMQMESQLLQSDHRSEEGTFGCWSYNKIWWLQQSILKNPQCLGWTPQKTKNIYWSKWMWKANKEQREWLLGYYLEKECTIMFWSQKNTGPKFSARHFYKLEKIPSELCSDT